MSPARFLIALLIGLSWSVGGLAADLPLKDRDCAKILERWAENPGSVPKHLVDACKDQMAAAPAPETVAALPQAAPVDPCAGPGAADSVLCWGPWASLLPAAGPAATVLSFPDEAGDCRSAGGISGECVPQLSPLSNPPEPPLEGCAPGTPCGFATIVDGLTSTGDVEATEFRKFDLAADGTSFTVDPAGSDEIASVAMDVIFSSRPDDFQQMRSRGREGDDESRLIARVVRDGESGDVELAADIWTNGNRSDSGLNRSGYFAWGVATSQSGLSLLNGNGTSLSFAGPMSVDNATNAAMTVNFGSQPSWTGTWTNPAWSFGAGGSVTGADLLSNPAQFTSNVQSGSFVQGALLGEPGQMGIAHIIDVTLTDDTHIRDVGLLREITAAPSVTSAVTP